MLTAPLLCLALGQGTQQEAEWEETMQKEQKTNKRDRRDNVGRTLPPLFSS